MDKTNAVIKMSQKIGKFRRKNIHTLMIGGYYFDHSVRSLLS